MIVQITATTDGRYIGHEFDSADNPIRLDGDVFVAVEKTMPIPSGVRFINTSYIIDTVEII